MNHVIYQPWGLFDRLQADIDRLFRGRSREASAHAPVAGQRDWVPTADIREDDERYVIYVDVPGVDAGDIDVRLEDGVLSIAGERRAAEVEQGRAYRRVERVRGRFLRRFSLPEEVDAGAVSARSTNGVLEVSVPKQRKPAPRRIEVSD